MCQYSADEGVATSWHTVHLGYLVLSGAALLLLEATAVSPPVRCISPQDLELWDDRTEQALATVVDTVKKHSPIALGIQLAHAGRKASTQSPWFGGGAIAAEKGGWETVAPPVLAHETPLSHRMRRFSMRQRRSQTILSPRPDARSVFNLIELRDESARRSLRRQPEKPYAPSA